jgi:hypothetical protein
VLTDNGALQHQVSRHQTASRRQQHPQQAGGNPVRRIRHHSIRPSRQPERGGGAVHNRHITEALTQQASAPRVQFDGYHPRPGPDQVRGERSLARADVEDQFARADSGRGDHPRRPFISEPVPAPRPA